MWPRLAYAPSLTPTCPSRRAARAAAAPLTEEETAALRAGGQVGESARRTFAARTVDAVLVTEGPTGAAKVLIRQSNRKSAAASRKRAREGAEALAREETRLKGRGAALLLQLGRGGSTELNVDDDDGRDKYGGLLETKGYKADVAALAKLEAENADALVIERKKNAIKKKRSRAFQRVAAEKAERRVALLKIRVAELDAELGALSNQ